MKRKYFLLLGVLFAICHLPSAICHAQDTTAAPKPYYPYPPPFPPNDKVILDSSEFVNTKLMQPTIGIGPGILTFYGDVSDKFNIAPSLSRMAYHLSVSEYITRSLMLSARALFGTLAGNERGPRFSNFESRIRSGGINITYNFDNFLPKKRRIDPFIVTGFEYFEYLTKADLFDASGNQYHYWSDGSLMNMDESAPNAQFNAIALSRDYTYETDVRKWNNSLFGKYSEHSFAVPFGAGVNLHLAPRWNFKLGATMHFSFTDYIDGITPDNKGAGKGDSKKDNFLETYFTLSFDLFNPKPPYISPLTDAEYLAIANEDTDGDGVIDFKDSCQGTPPGVGVDAKGCPIDSDGDRFPDYMDKEVNSPPGAFVDDNGVAMNDSTIARNWRVWSDTTGLYAYTDTIINPPAIAAGDWTKKRDATIVYRRELVILLGNYKEGVPPTEMGKLLNVPDVRNTVQPDSSTSYIAGSYNKTSDAEKRKSDMIDAGFPNAKIMVLNKDGSLSEPTADVLAGFKGDGTKITPPVEMKGVVFRVQLGAYSKKLSSSVFKNAGQTVELKTEDGLYKYLSGSSNTIQDALKLREELVKKGFNSAFVVAYKDNKRVPLSSVSGGIFQPKNENMEEPKTPKSAIDKNLVFFRVQVGAFVNEPPADILQKMNKVPGLEKKKKRSGVTQYLAGKFNSYEEAKKFRDEMNSKYGIPDAFMVAFFKDEMITVQEAVELLK
ncbi:MAG: SPOR domain-containing protein [Bacteroidetes bacterium]|nr:SPOR domain-containing protein [Bacteroidota bacterium]